MSHATTPDDASRLQDQRSTHHVEPSQVTGWVGWIGFAGVMMLLVGSFHVIQGFVAVFQDEYFLVTSSGLIVDVDYTVWGWTHVIAGLVVILAGIAVFTGKVWARAVGVVLAMLSALFNVTFLAAYPIWSTVMIAVDILVIWALTVHGGELREAEYL
jgi:vacuolar-type H+-ATPase subunit I/STV1